MSECLYKVLWSYVKSSFKYIRSPPCFEQMWPWWISLYPGNCSNDKSAFAVSHVSCRQMAPKNIPKEDNLLMIAKKLSNFFEYYKFILVAPKGWFNITHFYVSWFTEVHYFVFGVDKIWHYMIEIIFGANHIFKGIFVCYGIIRPIQSRL